jgi:hypothetical protein
VICIEPCALCCLYQNSLVGTREFKLNSARIRLRHGRVIAIPPRGSQHEKHIFEDTKLHTSQTQDQAFKQYGQTHLFSSAWQGPRRVLPVRDSLFRHVKYIRGYCWAP